MTRKPPEAAKLAAYFPWRHHTDVPHADVAAVVRCSATRNFPDEDMAQLYAIALRYGPDAWWQVHHIYPEATLLDFVRECAIWSIALGCNNPVLATPNDDVHKAVEARSTVLAGKGLRAAASNSGLSQHRLLAATL